jgi:hypothetical protein
MIRASRAIFLAGIFAMIGGMIGAGMIYREIRLQRHLHDRLCGIKLKLSEPSNLQNEEFSVYENGTYTLYLSTINPMTTQSAIDTVGKKMLLYRGIFEIRISDPSGRRVYAKQLNGDTFSRAPEYDQTSERSSTVTWTELDTVSLERQAEGHFSLAASVLTADNNFSHTLSEVVLMPPQGYDLGEYIQRQSMKLLGMGVLMISGFCAIVLSGYSIKRLH